MTRALRIAVADDEPDLREFYERMLPTMGHEVVATASSGSELVQRCLAVHPDLVITDIRMSDMDGIEAAARFCKEEPVPVILVSAYQEPDMVRRAQADYIPAQGNRQPAPGPARSQGHRTRQGHRDEGCRHRRTGSLSAPAENGQRQEP
jgi:CheY-like chemotaxis protein